MTFKKAHKRAEVELVPPSPVIANNVPPNITAESHTGAQDARALHLNTSLNTWRRSKAQARKSFRNTEFPPPHLLPLLPRTRSNGTACAR